MIYYILIILVLLLAAYDIILTFRVIKVRKAYDEVLDAYSDLRIQYDLDTQSVCVEDDAPEGKEGETADRYRYRCAMKLADEIARYVVVKDGKVAVHVKE